MLLLTIFLFGAVAFPILSPDWTAVINVTSPTAPFRLRQIAWWSETQSVAESDINGTTWDYLYVANNTMNNIFFMLPKCPCINLRSNCNFYAPCPMNIMNKFPANMWNLFINASLSGPCAQSGQLYTIEVNGVIIQLCAGQASPFFLRFMSGDNWLFTYDFILWKGSISPKYFQTPVCPIGQCEGYDLPLNKGRSGKPLSFSTPLYKIASNFAGISDYHKRKHHKEHFTRTSSVPLIPSGGGYSISLGIGTPVQNFLLTFDAGSAWLWAPSRRSSIFQSAILTHTQFDSKISSTFVQGTACWLW